MKHLVIGLTTWLMSSFAFAAGSDFINQTRLTITGANPAQTLEWTAEDLQAVFYKYKPALDSGTRIVRPLVIGGTRREPTLSITLEKCVLFVCQTVDLNADVSITPSQGSCSRNMVMKVDLNRSSQILTDVYESIDVTACLNGKTLDLRAEARHASKYSTGPVQQETFKMLKMQIDPIVKALDATLRENAK